MGGATSGEGASSTASLDTVLLKTGGFLGGRRGCFFTEATEDLDACLRGGEARRGGTTWDAGGVGSEVGLLASSDLISTEGGGMVGVVVVVVALVGLGLSGATVTLEYQVGMAPAVVVGSGGGWVGGGGGGGPNLGCMSHGTL